ncbi:MAG: hypothetical protein JXQ73_16830 [Phycisphaerae bacterium]|nr:hypothetical protein [Phycisphaerae bacterium]
MTTTSSKKTDKPGQREAKCCRSQAGREGRKGDADRASLGSREGQSSAMAMVPVERRFEIDKALIRQEAPLAKVSDVYEHFEVSSKYGVGRKEFEGYAGMIREVYAIGYADRLVRELLVETGASDGEPRMDGVTHRVVGRVTEGLAGNGEMDVSGLAHLASAATRLRRAAARAEGQRVLDAKEESGGAPSDAALREAIREIYGVVPDVSDQGATSP